MTTRVWTRAQLDDVYPLPDDDGWEWIQDPGVRGGWLAASGEGRVVCVLKDGRIRFGNMDDVPDRVALAVILMSQGLDSREAMAKRLHELDQECAGRTLMELHQGDREGACLAAGEGLGYRRAESIVSRGTVQP